MSEHLCACGQPAPDTTLCRSCADRLAADLGDVPAYAQELELTLARLTRHGRSDGSPSTTTALPIDIRASEASWVLRNTLTGWIRVLDGEGATWPEGTLTAMSRWLLARVDLLARHEEGDQAADEIGYAMRQVRHVVDRPPEQIYAGPCDTDACAADVYAKPGAQTARCRDCRTEYDVSERREWLLAAVEDILATATEIAQALPGLLERGLSVNTIRSWAYAGRLVTHGVDLQGRPLYRIGDVIHLALTTPTRQKQTPSSTS